MWRGRAGERSPSSRWFPAGVGPVKRRERPFPRRGAGIGHRAGRPAGPREGAAVRRGERPGGRVPSCGSAGGGRAFRGPGRGAVLSPGVPATAVFRPRCRPVRTAPSGPRAAPRLHPPTVRTVRTGSRSGVCPPGALHPLAAGAGPGPSRRRSPVRLPADRLAGKTSAGPREFLVRRSTDPRGGGTGPFGWARCRLE